MKTKRIEIHYSTLEDIRQMERFIELKFDELNAACEMAENDDISWAYVDGTERELDDARAELASAYRRLRQE